MFRLQGNKVQLHLYKINYKTHELVVPSLENINLEELSLDEQKEAFKLKRREIDISEFIISDEHKEDFITQLGDIPYTVESIDQIGHEWLEGMNFESYEQAQQAYEMGEQAYKDMLYANDKELHTSEYLVEMDFRLSLIELGVY